MQRAKEAIHNLNIVEVIKEYITLKKEGANYKACCPFHDEKTSSFVVSQSKGRYKCFGCGASGDAIQFVMEHERLDFVDAVESIAKTHNIPFEKKAISPEEKEKINAKEKLHIINKLANDYFVSQLEKNTGDEKKYALSRFSEDIIKEFGIGLATSNWTDLLDYLKTKKLKLNEILNSTLVRFSHNSEKYYDFFRERLMFPIHNEQGKVVGFTGRVFKETSTAKYLNSPETAAYQKSRVLYGLFQAKKHIVKQGYAILTEGQADVVSLHQKNIRNSVAGSGTALDTAQLNLLKKYTNELLLIYDNDAAGNKAWVNNGKLAMQLGFTVSVLVLEAPKSQLKINSKKKIKQIIEINELDYSRSFDPDNFFTSKKQFDWYSENYKEEYILKFAKTFFRNNKNATQRAHAFKNIALLLHSVDEVTRSIYIDSLKGIVSPIKALTDQLKTLLNESKKEEIEYTDEEDTSMLPRGVDAEEFLKYGFYEYHNCYHFKTKNGVVEGSNFIMKPLFHIKSINDSRRLYEIINKYGVKEVIDIEQGAMISLQMFRKVVESKGNFLWYANDIQFMKMKTKVYDKTQTCNLIEHLGWQKEGFWAFANITKSENEITPIDENGIIEHKEQFYFLPALSNIYKHDTDIYVNERKFVYKPSNLKINTWLKLFTKVYGDAAKLAIPFLLSSLFRDIIYSKFKMFPILNLFGPPGTGKSQMARSMMYWFGEAQDPYNIHNGTKVGLAEHLSEFSNAIAWVDEYKNNIDYDKVEMLKSTYDGVGRKKGSIDRGAKSKTSQILQSVLLGGQEMPTADVALLKRVMLIQFNKDTFSDEEKELYNQLKAMEQEGLSHFVFEILKYRGEMEKLYMQNFEDTLREFNKELNGKAIEDRILRNTVSMATTFKMFYKYLDFPYSYEDYRDIAIANIKEQSDFILNSREIQIFWNIYAVLFEKGEILEGADFRIETVTELTTEKGTKRFDRPTRVLIMRMAKVYTAYAALGRSTGQNILPESTLRYYLSTSADFISTKKSVRFTRTSSSAYVFKYDGLDINLVKYDATEVIEDDINSIKKTDKEELENIQTTIQLQQDIDNNISDEAPF